jgi:hypothetical protein
MNYDLLPEEKKIELQKAISNTISQCIDAMNSAEEVAKIIVRAWNNYYDNLPNSVKDKLHREAVKLEKKAKRRKRYERMMWRVKR